MKKTQNVFIIMIAMVIISFMFGCTSKDSMEAFEVTEKWKNEVGFNYCYIMHEGTYYVVSNEISTDVYDNYNIGWKCSDEGVAYTYLYADEEETVLFACGDFSAPVFKKGDEFYTEYEILTFQPVEDFGYAAPVLSDKNYLHYISDFSNSEMEEFDKIGIVGSRVYGDRKGSNPFFYGYEKGEKVTYSYTLDDKEWNNLEFVANCRCYKTKGKPIVLKCENRYGGFIKFDGLDSLPSGTYLIKEMNALITIK